MTQQEQYNQMVKTPIPRLITSLAIPTVISQMVSMIYNLVDAFFVGKLGTAAAAAIGILLSIQAIFQAIGFMCGHGAGSHVSMALAQDRKDRANMFASTAFFASTTISVIIAVILMIMRRDLMLFLGSTKTILPYAMIYGFYVLLCAPALSMSCTLNNIMRYEGRASLAMIGLVSGGVLNMIGDPILMFGFHMGIAGAGLSTCLSQYVSLFLLLGMFLSHRTISRISIKDVHLSGVIGKIIANGAPSLMRQALNAISTAALNMAANPYGDAAIAAMVIVGRIISFFYSVMIGVGQGFQPVNAYNYASKKYIRERKAFRFTFGLGEVLMAIFSLIGLLFSKELVALFRNDPKVIEIGAFALKLQCIALLFSPLTTVANMLYQSVGKSAQATFLASLRSGLFFIPIIMITPHFIGLLGVESAQMFSDIFSCLTCIPLVISFMRKIPHEDIHTEIDDHYQKS